MHLSWCAAAGMPPARPPLSLICPPRRRISTPCSALFFLLVTCSPVLPSLQVWSAADDGRSLFADIDRLVHTNLRRVQQAMRRHRIGPHHFAGSTGGRAGGQLCSRAGSAGRRLPPFACPLLDLCPSPTSHDPLPAGYGHGDLGRAALDEVVAEVMGAEAAAVRIQFVSGTHAISSALFGCLRCRQAAARLPACLLLLPGCLARQPACRLLPVAPAASTACCCSPFQPLPPLPARPPAGRATSCWRWQAARTTLLKK